MAERKNLAFFDESIYCDEKQKLSGKFQLFHFFSQDVENMDDVSDYPVLVEFTRKLCTELFRGMLMFSREEYETKKKPRKRFLLPDRRAQFWENPPLEALEQKLRRGETDYDFFFLEGWKKDGGIRRYEKKIYISSPCYTDQFFMDSLVEVAYTSYKMPYKFFLGAYQPEQAKTFSSIKALLEDYWTVDSSALKVYSYEIYGQILFEVNRELYSVPHLVKLLQETAEKNNINLEVMI